MKILVINGPNLNFLGRRDPKQYGTETYASLCEKIEKAAKERGDSVELFQNNCEGTIIDRLQAAYDDGTEGIVINPGAYTHYSYAIRDALSSVNLPAVEVHLSDINAREEFRRISVTAPACIAQISGEGFGGYALAIDCLLKEGKKDA